MKANVIEQDIEVSEEMKNVNENEIKKISYSIKKSAIDHRFNEGQNVSGFRESYRTIYNNVSVRNNAEQDQILARVKAYAEIKPK